MAIALPPNAERRSVCGDMGTDPLTSHGERDRDMPRFRRLARRFRKILALKNVIPGDELRAVSPGAQLERGHYLARHQLVCEARRRTDLATLETALLHERPSPACQFIHEGPIVRSRIGALLQRTSDVEIGSAREQIEPVDQVLEAAAAECMD